MKLPAFDAYFSDELGPRFLPNPTTAIINVTRNEYFLLKRSSEVQTHNSSK